MSSRAGSSQRTIEEIRRSNEATIAAFDRSIAQRQELVRQYQQLNQRTEAIRRLTALQAR